MSGRNGFTGDIFTGLINKLKTFKIVALGLNLTASKVITKL